MAEPNPFDSFDKPKQEPNPFDSFEVVDEGGLKNRDIKTYNKDREDVIRAWMLENRYRDGVMGRLEDGYAGAANEIIYGRDPEMDRQLAIVQAKQNGWAQPETDRTDSGTSAGDGVIRGVTLNFNDELAGVVGGAVDAVSGGSFDEGYRKTRAKAQRQERESKYSNPEAFLGGEIGGGVSTMVVPAAGVVKTGGAANKVRATATAGQPLRAAGSAGKDVVKTVATGAGIGGLWGAGYGFGDGEDLEDRLDKAGDTAVTGGLFGGALAPVTRYIGAPVFMGIRRKFFTSAENKALDAILTRAERSGRTLDDVQADFDKWTKQGDVPETLAELMGPNERELLSALVTSHKPTREAAEQTLLGRGRDEVDWLGERFAKSFGKDGKSFKAAQREAERARVEDPEPFYSSAHFADDGALNVLSPESSQGLMAELSQSRVAQGALGKASDYADTMNNTPVRNEIDRLQAMIADGSTPDTITVQAADYIERAVSRRLNAARSGSGEAALDIPSGLKSLRDRIRLAIDDSGLGAARSVAADRIRRGELLEEGRDIFKPGRDVEDVEAIMRGIPEEDIPPASADGREAFQAGAVRAISDKLGNVPDMVGFANSARSVARTPAMRAKLDAARPKRLNKDGVTQDGRTTQTRLNNELDESIDRVSARADFTNDMVGNSKTAFRQGAVQSAVDDDAFSTHMGDALSDLLLQGPISAVGNIRQRYGKAVGNYLFRPSVYNPLFNRHAREILLAQGDSIPEAIARLRARQSKSGRVPTLPKRLAEPILKEKPATAKGKPPAQAGFVSDEMLRAPGAFVASKLRALERYMLSPNDDRHYADMMRSGAMPDKINGTKSAFEQMLTPRAAAEELADIAGRAEQRGGGRVPSIRKPMNGRMPIMRDVPKRVSSDDGDAIVMTHLRQRAPEVASERAAKSSSRRAETALRKARRELKRAEAAYEAAPGFPGSNAVVTPANRGEFAKAAKRVAEAREAVDAARARANHARQQKKALDNASDGSFQALRQELGRRGMNLDRYVRDTPPLTDPAPAGNRPAVDSRMARLMLDPKYSLEASRVARDGGRMNTFDRTGDALAWTGIGAGGYGAGKAFEGYADHKNERLQQKRERSQNNTIEYHNHNSINLAQGMTSDEMAELQAVLNYTLAKSDKDMISMDGKWGNETRQMLKRYQRANGLKAHGKVTGQTLEALQKDYSLFRDAASEARGTQPQRVTP